MKNITLNTKNIAMFIADMAGVLSFLIFSIM